jgi:hypothetical protein
MPTALTLADYSQLAKDDGKFLTAGVIDTLRKESFLLDLLPFKTLGTLSAKNIRIKSLPTVQNRKVNASYTHTSGDFDPIEEQGFLYGGKVQIDRVYSAAKGQLIEDMEAKQVELFTTALAYQFNYDFLNGDPTSTPDGITGLRFRINNDLSSQKFNAGGVDISPDTASPTTTFNTFYDLLDQICYALPEHKADALLMNDTVLMQVRSGLRRLGLLNQTEDMFGRTVDRWGPNGPMLIDVGLKGDQSTRILPNTETSAGVLTGGATSSIFAVRFGEEYLTGWQLDEMKTFKNDFGTYKEVIMDWYAGLFITNPRSVAWLYNIVAA